MTRGIGVEKMEKRISTRKEAVKAWNELFKEPSPGRGVPLNDLESNQCHWIVSDYLYCGKPKKKDSRFSYCPEHLDKMLAKRRPR